MISQCMDHVFMPQTYMTRICQASEISYLSDQPIISAYSLKTNDHKKETLLYYIIYTQSVFFRKKLFSLPFILAHSIDLLYVLNSTYLYYSVLMIKKSLNEILKKKEKVSFWKFLGTLLLPC